MTHKWNYFIDASTSRTGIVLLRDDRKKVIITDLDFSRIPSKRNSDKITNQINKFRKIKQELDKFTKKYPPAEDIYIEGIFVKPAFLNSSEVLIKFHGFLILYFIEHNLIYYPPRSIKKKLTGNGNAKKEDVRKMLEEKYGIEFSNDDQSDAFAVMEYWMRKEGEMLEVNL